MLLNCLKGKFASPIDLGSLLLDKKTSVPYLLNIFVNFIKP